MPERYYTKSYSVDGVTVQFIVSVEVIVASNFLP